MTTTTELRKLASRGFTETQWSLVRAAGDGASPTAASAALDQLCEKYWSPIYVYLRQRGYSEHDAEDLTQEFFKRILEDKSFARAKQSKGKFRYYLLGALHHFIINEWDKTQAVKRGAGFTFVSLDEAEIKYSEVPSSGLSPEKAFDIRWRLTLLEQSVKRLEEKYKADGKEQEFLLLKPFLTSTFNYVACERIARLLQLSLNAAEVALHRLKRQFRKAVRAELAQTVAGKEEFEQELRELFGKEPEAT